MRTLKRLLYLPLIALNFVSCTSMQMPIPTPEQAAQMRANYQSTLCNYDGAFERGVNDAIKNLQMNGQAIATYCPPETRSVVMEGYRNGYQSVANRPQNPPTVIVVQPHQSTRPRECLKAYGRESCGYGCKAAGGDLQCAQNPNHDCIIYAGKVYCGLNCRGSGGTVTCER